MSPHPPGNLLLASLPADLRSSIIARCEHVELPVHAMLFDAVGHPRHVHFMTSGVASTVTMMQGGEAVEVGLTGREGIAEKYHLLGPQIGVTRCFMQIAGTGFRMSFKPFQAEFLQSTPLLQAVHRYIQHDALVLAQLGACNRLHEVEERLARWLLMVYDRIETDEIKLTQEFLGEMLGARRSSVNLAAGSLQRSGYITYSHGKIHIQNRDALEEVACECYPTISKLFRNMYK